MEYKVPLTKKDREKLLQEYHDFHLRPAPSNIGDETLIKAIQQINETKNPQSGEEQKGASNEAQKGNQSGSQSGTPGDELKTEREKFFKLNGKNAPESATIEQLKEQNALKEQEIEKSNAPQSKTENQKPEIKYNPETEVLIIKGNEERIVSKTSWDKFLSKFPGGWEKKIVTPKELTDGKD